MEVFVSGDVDAATLSQELTDGLGEPIEVTVVDPRGEPRIVVPPMVSDTPRAFQIVEEHRTPALQQLDQLVVKARAVWAGTDTFTVAQVQKILAGLVLLENRRR